MLYLIGGAPGVGKSFLAKHIGNKHHAEIVELDGLMPAYNASISKEDFSAKLPVWQAKHDRRTPSFSDYKIEAHTYWPHIKSLIEDRLNKVDLPTVIEGAQLSPMLIKDWLNGAKASERKRVKILYLSHGDGSFNEAFVDEAMKAGFKVFSRSEVVSEF
ncbi:MAG: hypothetical protein JWN01_128 [Patescibacteria group bacterium]|nr:hypothetical protein [Patescibacteria group bacterium]